MINKLSYRKNRVDYNTEETGEAAEEGVVTGTVTGTGTGTEVKTTNNPVFALLIFIFLILIMFGVIYFWYWVFKNVFSILRGK